MMKTLLFSTLAVTLLLTLSACNTMRGVGRDVSNVGYGIQRSTR